MDPIKQLREQVEMLRRRMDQQNVRRIINQPPFRQLTIIGGNTLSSGQAGIKHVTTQTTCPADYDPNVDTSYADGWGNAYMFINGKLADNKVLVLNDGGLGTLVEGWEGYTSGPVCLPFGSINKICYRVFVR
jgi:hypothetical protein